MKKQILLLMVICALTITMKAQVANIPNNGFENWVTIGNCLEPASWMSSNLWDSLGTFFPITRSTDHYPASAGNYSIRIESNASLLPHSTAYGVAWSGDSYDPGKPSFPVTGHPANFCGFYKFLPQNHDTVYINIVLFKNGVPVSYARVSDTITVSDWTSFTLPFPSYTSVDSAKITLASYFGDNGNYFPHGNSVLYVDNLSFDNLINSIGEVSSANSLVELYPNPASEFVTLKIKNKNSDAVALNIYKVTGELVRSEMLMQNQQKINIGELNNGIYMVRIQSKSFSENQKLVIQR